MQSIRNFFKDTLIDAAKKGDLQNVKSLIRAGADLEAKAENGRTALIWAAYQGQVETAQYLVAAGAELEAKDTEYGQTALMFAAYNGHVAVAQCLVTAGAELNAKATGWFNTNTNGWRDGGKTALIFAALNGRLEIAQFLVTAGANVNAARTDGKTALMRAAQSGHVAVAQCLVGAGAELEAKDEDGMTALLLAAQEDRVAVAEYFVKCSMYAGKLLPSKISLEPAILKIEEMLVTKPFSVCSSFLYRTRTILSELSDIAIAEGGGVSGFLARSRIKIRVLLRAKTFPHRVNLLAARICGVVFPEGFIKLHSGMSMPKFIAVSSLMRSSKLIKLSHGVNLYFFVRMNIPSDIITNILSFIVGGSQAIVMAQEIDAIKLSSIAPAAAVEPEPRQVASDAGIVAAVSP